MLDNPTNAALLVALLPLVAVVGIALNLFMRARGGRTFFLSLKAFGVDLKIESTGPQTNRPNRGTHDAP